jgi:hypothetical protein
MKRRARLIAVLVVLTSIVSAAWGQLVVTDQTATSRMVPSLTRGVVVVGIRNGGSTTVTVDTIFPPMAALPGCDGMIAHAIGGLDGNINRTLAAGEMVQIQIDTDGWDVESPTPHDCTFDVVTTPAQFSTTMRVIFNVSPTPDMVELQPRTMQFANPMTTEQQVLEFINYTGQTNSFRFTLMGDSRFRWVGCVGQSCDRNNVAPNTIVPLTVECVGPIPSSAMAPIFVQRLIGGSGGPTLATTIAHCGGTGSGSGSGMIQIVDDVSINIPPGTGTADVISTGMPAERIRSASLTPGSPVLFTEPNCPDSQTCVWAGSGDALPKTLNMRCTGPGNATLQVMGNMSGSNASVECLDTGGGGPVIQLPGTVMSPDVAVNMTSTTTFQIMNTGSAPLNVQPMSFPSPWSGTSGCTAGCTVGSGGTASVGVAFSPDNWQPDPYTNTLVVSSDATNTPSANVMLTGTGRGATLDVTEPDVTLPNNLVIDFRRIARGPPAELPLQLYADGNIGTITAQLQGLAPPFSVAPPTLGMDAQTEGTFVVRCGSDTALPPTERTITIQSNAYQITPTTQVTLKCEVLDTQVTVNPTTFPFDEVRINTAAVEKPFTIKNEGTSTATVEDIRLSGSSSVLELEHGSLGPLVPGAEIVGKLIVTPSAEAEVEMDLEIDVDGLMLAYPVTAKVVTPAAKITPTSLELGTVCVGTQASGEIVVTNTGTATLKMAMPPTMDMAFIPFYDTIYPYDLMEDRMVSTEIRPASSSAGMKDGTLTWEVDASLPPFIVPVTLETIGEGTAISPGKVELGTWDVGARSPDRVIRLENCSMAPVEILHRGVVSTRGRADAWDVRPKTDSRVLGAHDTMLITVAFVPTEAGVHRAELSLEIDGQQRFVPLEAEGIGLFLDKTSFYACSCSSDVGPRGLLGLVPVLFAFLFATRRRRPC